MSIEDQNLVTPESISGEELSRLKFESSGREIYLNAIKRAVADIDLTDFIDYVQSKEDSRAWDLDEEPVNISEIEGIDNIIEYFCFNIPSKYCNSELHGEYNLKQLKSNLEFYRTKPKDGVESRFEKIRKWFSKFNLSFYLK